MIIVKWNDGTRTFTDGTFLGLLADIVDEWNRENWKEVIAACRVLSEGGDVPEFEAKWGIKFERL